MKNITYSGRSLWNCGFNLYEHEESFNFDKTKKNILREFKEQYIEEIKTKLKILGLNFKSLNYYSPHAYNFDADSIDLTISIKNKAKLKNAIVNKKEVIQEELNKNKSYDGYMALSIGTVEEELSKMEDKNYEIDIIVLNTLLNMNCSDFNIIEHFVLCCAVCKIGEDFFCEYEYCQKCHIKNNCKCSEFEY